MADEKDKPKAQAKTPEQEEGLTSKSARGSFRTSRDEPRKMGVVGYLTWAVLAVAVIVVVYMLFIGGDPRREYTTPEETLRGYTELISPYVAGGGIRPGHSTLEDWLTFFDSGSRDYFRENAPYMAALRLQFDEERLDQMSTHAQRVEAMFYLLRRPPLSGIALVESEEELEDGRVRLTVRGATGGLHTITMSRRAGLWYMEDLGGVRDAVDRDIASIRERMRQ